MSDLNETFRKCLPDIYFGIAITIQNWICMIHLKHSKKIYREIWKTLSEFTQLRLIELKLLEIISGILVASLFDYVDISTPTHFLNARACFWSKIIIVEYKVEKSKLRFFLPWFESEQERSSCLFNNFAQDFVISLSHMYHIDNISRECLAGYCLAAANNLQLIYYITNLRPMALWFLVWRLKISSCC